MLNQLVVVGRLTSDPEIKEVENNRKIAIITVAVPRAYKNENGENDTDFITCTLFNGIAETTTEYCKKGDILGIKGRLQGNGETLEVIAEKVTFLSSKKAESED